MRVLYIIKTVFIKSIAYTKFSHESYQYIKTFIIPRDFASQGLIKATSLFSEYLGESSQTKTNMSILAYLCA